LTIISAQHIKNGLRSSVIGRRRRLST